MRLTIGVAASALLCLLGSGVLASTIITQPAVNGSMPSSGEPSVTMNNSADAERDSGIRQCVSGAPRHLPAGADATAFCTCAVDKMMTENLSQRDAVNQCATAMHITLHGLD